MIIAMSRPTKIFAIFGLVILVSAAVVIWIYKPWSNSNDGNNNNEKNNETKINNKSKEITDQPKSAIVEDTKNLSGEKPLSKSNDKETPVKDEIPTPVKTLKLTEIKNTIKSFYVDEYNLIDNDTKIRDDALNDRFEDLNQEANLRKICLLGIKLLRNYLKDPNNNTNYLNITGKIVDKVLTQTNNINAGKTFGTDEEWELYIVDIPHLMAMYDLIAEDDSSNSTRLTQCYEYIKKVINSNMEPIYSRPTPSKTDFIKIGTPYLITNYKRSLKDGDYNNLYKQAKNNDNLKSLNKYLLYDDTDTAVNKKYGFLRKDGGAMLENNTVNYSKYIELIDKIKYPDLYAAVYEKLDVLGNLYNSAKVILNKVLHKDVLYFPFGLFSFECEMLKKKYYWNFGNPKGITIMPSIGVGIYKTDKFMFSVRVQKKNIPICSIEDLDETNIYYAMGVMQLRTILLAKKNYEKDYLSLNDWETLKNEPGIMAFYEGMTEFTYPILKANESNLYSSKIDDNDDNYIGQIPEDNLMFWKNYYGLSLTEINVEVKEYGVAHKNGIVIEYRISTNYSKYQIHYYFENDYKENFETPITNIDGGINPQSDLTYYESDNSTHNFKWSMILKNQSSDVGFQCDFDTSKQTVTCGAKEYKIEILDDHKHYLVKSGSDDYLIGAVSDEREQTTNYNSQTWTRDEETLMYKKSSSK